MKLYFAYGSNMCEAQMKKRCPQSQKIGNGRLFGFRWIITTRGYASIIASANDTIEGVLYKLTESDEKSLDDYEGVATGDYTKEYLPIVRNDSNDIALVYIDPVTSEGEPKAEYARRMNKALETANLPNHYVDRYIRKFVPAESDVDESLPLVG